MEVFGAEKLLEDPTKLSMQEGQFVSKTINSFKTLIKSSGALMGKTFDYEQSIVTQLLFDELGGNCNTSFIFSVNPSHSPVINYSVLELLDALRNMVLYPIQNGENFQALLCFHRVRF